MMISLYCMEKETQIVPTFETETTPQSIAQTHKVTKQKSLMIIGFTISILFLLLITSFLIYQNYQLRKQLVQKQSVLSLENINPSPQPSSKSIVLKIPIIEYESPGNKLTKAIITGYEDKIINIEEEFVIDPATLGYLYENSVGDIKLKLVEVKKESIVVEILADKIYDGSFYPRNPIEREEIMGSKCIAGRPLATDISSKYCFTLSINESQFSLSYTLEEESTMSH